MGNVVFLIADTSVTNESLKHLSTRDSVSYGEESGTASLRSPHPEAVPEKLSLVAWESEAPTSPPPRPMAPTPPASPPSASIHCPPNVPPQPPSPSPKTLTPQYLQTTTQLPQCYFGYSPQKSGVDRIPAGTYGDATVHPKYVFSPGTLPDETMTAAPSFVDEDSPSGPAPQGPAEIGSFTPVICEPPEDIASEGSESWSSVPLHATESTFLPTPSGVNHSTIPHISITLAKSSRGNSPLAPSTCDSDVTVKRPSVHVDTGSATQAMGVAPIPSTSPGLHDGLSPFSRSALLASPQPKTSTTNTSSSGLSPFSRTSMVESPSTAATTPAQSAVSEGLKGALTSAPGPNAKQRKERPTIDTSCVGPRGQVRKYRNGSVPPVHVPIKLRNASLDLPRCHEYEKFEPNPSMYSIAPSISPGHVKKSGDLRCPSSQSPASRPGLAPSSRTRASSIRREPLEFDEAQVCLDTANLGDQEVATFLKEVDAALSAIVNGAPAVAADSRAFLAVPSASSRHHQSRKPSSQHLRADLSATVRNHEKVGATRTGFSLVATSRTSPHPPDVIPSRAASPLSGHTDTIPRLFLSQVDMTPGSLPGSSSRSAVPISTFPLPQRVSPQPSARQELVEWVPPSFASTISTRTKQRLQLSRPGSYYGDVSGNENAPEVVRLQTP